VAARGSGRFSIDEVFLYELIETVAHQVVALFPETGQWHFGRAKQADVPF
jgi:hypothetical protein